MLKPAAIALLLTLGNPVTSGVAAPSFADQYARMCANVLNFLPRIVRKEQVAAVAPGTAVLLHSICRGVQLNDFGNAAGLTRTIARNPTLSQALARRGWRPDDVVGINIHGDTVDLYVHRF
ncbi:MAG TPA: hypothetical protein VHA07_03410 [Devosia sp.]|nr:hypothetical protein [Devosia sp.]